MTVSAPEGWVLMGMRFWLVATLLALSMRVQAQVPEVPPSSWIHDGAGLLDAAELQSLARERAELEGRTGATLVVVTLRSLPAGVPAKVQAVQTLNRWMAGKRSVLLLVVMKPHAPVLFAVAAPTARS